MYRVASHPRATAQDKCRRVFRMSSLSAISSTVQGEHSDGLTRAQGIATTVFRSVPVCEKLAVISSRLLIRVFPAELLELRRWRAVENKAAAAHVYAASRAARIGRGEVESVWIRLRVHPSFAVS